MMKKTTAMVLSMMLALSLAGCGAEGNKEADTTKENGTKTDAVIETGDDTAQFTYEQKGDSIVLTKYTGAEESVFIPNEIDGISVTEIGESCFAGDIHVKRVHVPEGVTTIGDYAFECCAVLEKVYLPETLKVIKDGAFSGCGNLNMLDMQDQVEEIGNGAFLFCRNLEAFHAPDELKSIGEFAFAGCENLYVADLDSSQLIEIPARAFCGDIVLTKVTFPETLNGFGMRAFSECIMIDTMYFPENVNHISSYAFENCDKLTSIDIRGGEVDANAFAGCHGMTSANFSEAPITLHKDAFANTAVVEEEQYIPENVTIEEGAFPKHEEPAQVNEEEDSMGGPGDGVNEEDSMGGPGDGVNEEGANEEITVPAGENVKTADEIIADAKQAGYKVVPVDEFDAWADEYLEYNKDTADFERYDNVYIDLYKRQQGYYYTAMTAAATKNQSDIDEAMKYHHDDFIPMFEMANHGLRTEMGRFRMQEDMLLLTGVYDSQLMAAAGTDKVPTMEELKAKVGTTFTDPCLTSTTNDISVAVGFSDTLFIIYAPAKSLDALGTVCMDAYMRTFEKETLLFSGATYEIMDVGYFSYDAENEVTGDVQTAYEKYIIVKLLNQ